MESFITRIKERLCSQKGESIGETLVSLLIAALALVMLAGAMTSASNIIISSRNKLESYYDANESLAKRESGTPMVNTLKLEDTSGAVSSQTITVSYYQNTVFSDKPVVVYDIS